ncbi:MAG: hypothetical protein ABIL78_08055 [candidate division WOR-3 bacterium]
MNRFFLFIFVFSCSDEFKIKIEDINKFYIYCPDEDVRNYFISTFDTMFYNFVKLSNLNKLKEVNNLIVILNSSDKEFFRFYKFINSNFGYKLNTIREGSFLMGIFGENAEDLKYNIYKYRRLIDSLLEVRVYELAYKRAYYFGVDKEKSEIISKHFGIVFNIPVGWNFLEDSISFSKNYFTMFKKNPERKFTLYIPKSYLGVDYESVLKLTKNFINDSLKNVKISKKTIEKICIDGSYKEGFFRSCIKNNAYFYNIEVKDTSLRNALFYIIEIDGFLSRIY